MLSTVFWGGWIQKTGGGGIKGFSKKVIHIVLNDFAPDYRVLKETTALRKAGFQVSVFALWDLKMPRLEIIEGVKVHRFHLRSRVLPRRKMFLLLKFAECALRMFWLGVRERPDIVHAHDLDGLTVAYLIAQCTRCSLIYDSHELWSGSGHLARYSNWAEKIAVVAERLMVKRANEVITVSDGIAMIMEKNFAIRRPIVVRNLPDQSSVNDDKDMRQLLGIPAESIIFLYIGGIIPDRGTDLILEAFTRVEDSKAHLVFLGQRELPTWLKANLPSGVANRIHFLPPVHPSRVITLARGADIGLHAIRGNSESHRWCLPNKLFEYIHAGLAVLVTDLPEMATIVGEHGVGCVFRDDDVKNLEKKMQFLLGHPEKVKQFRDASQEAAKVLTWNAEKHLLLEVYQR